MLNASPRIPPVQAEPYAVPEGQAHLARFIRELRCEQLPVEVREQGRRVVADLVGVIAAGLREPEVARLAGRLAGTRGGRSTVIGIGDEATAEAAALLHGTAGTSLELDEGNRFSRGHPGIHVLPAALAVAQETQASGAQLLGAFIAGYEVAARIGAASDIRPAMHPHGTWGTVGAAVAVRKLLGGSQEAFERTIAVASTLGLATSVNTMRDGGTVRNAFAGASGKLALLANDLVDAGFTGEADGLSSVFGGVVSGGFTWGRMLDGLGRRWEIRRNYFKLHACCRFAHATLDALTAAVRAAPAPLEHDLITGVDVHTYGLAARLVNAEPVNPLAAKYSLPFAVATALVHGSTGVEAFGPRAIGDERVLRLARRVHVHEDTAMTGLLPALRQARVVLRLAAGDELTGFARTNRGDAEDPIPDAELRHKFMTLAAGTWSGSQAAELHGRLLSLDTLADVSRLFRLD
jgi:2-methylcitrate dehydratase PrpD